MTIALSDSRAAGNTFRQPAPVQLASPNTSVPLSADKARFQAITPSPFEQLFSQQLASVHPTGMAVNERNAESLSPGVRDLISNPANLSGPKAKSPAQDDGSGFNPLVNPLTVALLTTPSYSILEALNNLIAGSTAALGASAVNSRQENLVANSTTSPDATRTVESVTYETAAIDDQSISEESRTSESTTAAANNETLSPNQPEDRSFRSPLPEMTYDRPSATIATRFETRDAFTTATQDHARIGAGQESVSSFRLISSGQAPSVGEIDAEIGNVKITAQTAVGSAEHLARPADGLTTANSLLIPLVNYFSVNNVTSNPALPEELAAEFKRRLEDEPNEEPTSVLIQLDQLELGRIDLYLSIRNNIVSVRIKTKDSRTKRIIEDQMENLRESLTDNGVTCGQFLVAGDTDDQQFTSGEESEPKQTVSKRSPSSRWTNTPPMTPLTQSKGELNIVA
jgi:flagellar hook-length control protein FliK